MDNMGLETCKYCGATISKGLHRCPHCGASLKTPLWVYIVIGLLSAGIVALLCIPPASSQNQDPPVEPKVVEYSAGERGLLDNVFITIQAFTESDGDETHKPAEGKVFLHCLFVVENNSPCKLTLNSILNVYAYCDGSLIFETVESVSGSLDGEVEPGGVYGSSLQYEVPKEWKNVEIHFHPAYSSKNYIKFVLNNPNN